MSAGEFYQIFSGFGRGLRDRQEWEDQKQYAEDAAKLAGKQLDSYLTTQGGQASTGAPQSGLSALGATPIATKLPTFAQGSNVGAYGDAIAGIESGGRYDIVGPTHPKYGQALGRYQVMESNLPSWSQEALGRQVSKQEFLTNPQIQDAIFQKKFGQSVEKYGNPQDAASVWFTGRPLSQGAKSRDSLGTTGQKYVDMFTANLGKAGGPPIGQSATLPATAMQMPIVNPPMPPQRPVQIASADPDSLELPPSVSGINPGSMPRAPMQPPQMRPGAGPVMTMPGQPAPQVAPAQPQGALSGQADMPAPNAQPAGFQIPPGPQPQSPPQQVAQNSFIPGTVAAPAIGGPQQGQLPPVAGAPRLSPQQAEYLRAQLANPLTRANAIQAIQGLNTPDKWETKELGGRVVQVNSRGDVRALPGFEKPTTYQTQKGADGNDYTFNPQTGQWTRAIEGKNEGYTTLITPEQRAQFGVDPTYKGVVQVGPGQQLHFPGKASTEVNVNQTAEKAQDSKIGGAYGDTFNELQTSGRNAIGQLNTYRLMEKLIDNPNFYSGAQSGPLLAARRAAAALGIKDADAAAPNELFAKLATQSVLDKLGGSLGAGVSNSDVLTMQNTVANATNTPEGNRQILQFSKALAQRQMEVAKLARQYAGAHGGRLDPGFDDTLAAYAEANPMTVAPTEMQQRQAAQAAQAAQQGGPRAGGGLPTLGGRPAQAQEAVSPSPYREGQTATNPQTGAKAVFQGGRWVPVQQAPVPSQAGGIL